MAGPAYLSVGTVVDPYAGAQKALSQVGDIYNSFYDNQKKAEEARNQRLQREELQKQSDLQQQRRDTLSTYDPNLGVDGRGIETEVYNRSIEEENAIRASNEAALKAGHPDAIPSSELEKKLAEARKTLVTRRAAERTIASDLLRTGIYSPEEITALTPLYSMNARDLSAELASHQQGIKDQQEIDKAKREAALEIQKLYATDDTNRVKLHGTEQAAQNSLNRSGRGTNSPSGTNSGKRPPNLDVDGYNKFQTWAEKQLGSKVWNLDGRNAERLVSNTAANINKELYDAGWGNDTFVTTGETAEFVINNVHAGWWDRNIRSGVRTQPDFEAAFSASAGLPPRNADGGFLTPEQVEAQGGNPNTIRNDSRGYGSTRDTLPAPNLTGVRPELVDAVRRIPDYKAKTREELYTEMLDNAYKNLRLPEDENKNKPNPAAVRETAERINTKVPNPRNTLNETPLGDAAGVVANEVDSNNTSNTDSDREAPADEMTVAERAISELERKRNLTPAEEQRLRYFKNQQEAADTRRIQAANEQEARRKQEAIEQERKEITDARIKAEQRIDSINREMLSLREGIKNNDPVASNKAQMLSKELREATSELSRLRLAGPTPVTGSSFGRLPL